MTERPKNPQWRSERNKQRFWTAARRKCNEEGRCRRCHATGHLDPAHIIPRSRVRPGAGEDPRNIVPLCRRCHDAEHAGLFVLGPFLTVEELEYATELVGAGEAERRLNAPRCPFDCLCSLHERKAA